MCSLCGKALEPVDIPPEPEPEPEPTPAPGGFGSPPPIPGGFPPARDQPPVDQAAPSYVAAEGDNAEAPDLSWDSMSKQQLIENAERELKAEYPQSAAKYYLEAIRRNPSDMRLQKTFWQHFNENDLKFWNIQIPPVPLWRDLPAIFKYPFRDDGVLGLFIWAACLGATNFIGWIGAAIATTCIANWVAKHLKWSAAGRPTVPGLAEFKGSDVLYFIGATLATWLPLIAFGILAGGGLIMSGSGLGALGGMLIVGVVLFLALNFMYPMALLVAMMFNRALLAFNYPLIVQSIRLSFKEYLFACLLFLGFSGIESVWQLLSNLMPSIVIQIAMGYFSWVLKLYFLALFGHVLGRVYYNNERKLAWFDESRPSPSFSPVSLAIAGGVIAVLVGVGWYAARGDAHQRATAVCSSAVDSIEYGEPEQAIEQATEALEILPNYAGAYVIRGQAYGELGQSQKAIEEYTAAIESHPKYAYAYKLRSIMYTLTMQPEKAAADSAKVKEIMEAEDYEYDFDATMVYGAAGKPEWLQNEMYE